MPLSLPLADFLKQPGQIIDVRSPSEFKQGHMPGSISFPLFDDHERAIIGTAYKQQNRIEAIQLGLSIMVAKIEDWINKADALQSPQLNVMCWRGGMRSGFAAQIFKTIGYNSSTLQGGYKVFRNHALSLWNRFDSNRYKLFVLGGLTGSGKTEILHELKKQGEQVLDLEGLANHRGSAFGNIGLKQQPTQEQFENNLAQKWLAFSPAKPIWIEDENRVIGKCHLPAPLYQAIHQAQLFYIECPQEERLFHLMQIYGNAPSENLVRSTLCLARRLGGALTQEIIKLIQSGNIQKAIEQSLPYYDKTYAFHLQKRTSKIHLVKKEGFSNIEKAYYLKEMAKENNR